MEERIKIKNEQGEEKEFDVIFSFDSDKTKKHCIVYTNYEEENNTIKCYSSVYENNKLLPIKNKEDQNIIDSILNTLNNSQSAKYNLDSNE